jgi:hypothetical protein
VSDNRVQHPSWAVLSDSLTKDPTCGGKIFSPHASDCHKYYLCQFGVLTEQTCPAGLYWNKVKCKLIYNKLPSVAVIGTKKTKDLSVVSVHWRVSSLAVHLYCHGTGSAVYKWIQVPTWHAYAGREGSGGMARTHLQPSIRKRWVIVSYIGRFAAGKDLVHILQEAELFLGPVRTAQKILPSLGFDSQNMQLCTSNTLSPG